MHSSIYPFLTQIIIILSLLSVSLTTLAQSHQFGGWSAWFNTVKINQRWGLLNDIQFRAGKDWKDNSSLLLRPGMSYQINSEQTIAMGYAAIITNNQLATLRLTEHRIWEQYIITNRIFQMPFQHRFRLEQRFLRTADDQTNFTQRIRYFFRGVLPLSASWGQPFNRGTFIALQNELFFNVQHTDAANHHIFDQNRAYIAIGYKFSPRYDLEIGYMNQFLKKYEQPNHYNHIMQLAFYTRFSK